MSRPTSSRGQRAGRGPRVGPAARPPEPAMSTAHLLPIIQKAKQEWECTADALSAMVCLLSEDGVVLRVNRVVEHWGLGSVSSVLGKSAHSVLHPECADPACDVARGL